LEPLTVTFKSLVVSSQFFQRNLRSWIWY